MDSKIRISVSETTRITDCDKKLIKLIDRECQERKISRAKLISELYNHPIKNKEDVKELRKFVKEQGFKTVEQWLKNKLGE